MGDPYGCRLIGKPPSFQVGFLGSNPGTRTSEHSLMAELLLAMQGMSGQYRLLAPGALVLTDSTIALQAVRLGSAPRSSTKYDKIFHIRAKFVIFSHILALKGIKFRILAYRPFV